LQHDDKWMEFVENIARLKYEEFDNSQILNDLDVAGALMLQVEGHYDETSLVFLYQIISDLYSGINNEADKFGVASVFGKEERFQQIHNYLQSKV
jgi:hypothetical protein